MKVVKVYGALRDLLGKTRFEFVADTPAQAMRALLVNFPGLDKWLIDSEKRGVAYRVTVGKQKVHDDDMSGMFAPWSEREVFSITPVLTGSGRGFGMILAGVAIVAASIFIPGLGFKLAGSVVTKVGLFGGSLILGIATKTANLKPPSQHHALSRTALVHQQTSRKACLFQ